MTSATALIQGPFWDMIQVYFLNSRDSKINDKLDVNSYSIIAKHLVVLASVDSVKDCIKTLWTQLDALLVQTVVDCGSVATRAPLDMDVFCQKTGGFLAALSSQIKAANNPKHADLTAYTSDLAKRLLLASVESSIVHKDKSFGLLMLSNQLVNTYPVQDTKGLVDATEHSLTLLEEGPENTSASLASYYVTLISKLDDASESTKLWHTLMNTLSDMFSKDALALRSAMTLVLVLEQIHAENIALDATYQSDALDQMVENAALVRLNEAAIIVPRPVLESIVSWSLRHHLCKYAPHIRFDSLSLTLH